MPYNRLSVAGGGVEKMPGGGGELMRGMSLGSGPMLHTNSSLELNGDSGESWDIVQRLLAENCYLKSGEIRERLQKLKKSMPKFSKYHQEIKNLNQPNKLCDSLSDLANQMTGIQKKAQMKMVSAKIIDLENMKDMSLAEKNENIEKFLKNSKKNLEEIRSEAYGYLIKIFL